MRALTLFILMALSLSGARASVGINIVVRDAGTGSPVPNAVIMLPDSGAAQPLDQPAVVVQSGRQFHPHLQVVPVGSLVEFPNRDNTQHHVYSFSPARRFNIELYSGRPESPIRFPDPGVVELGCNIHDRMQAFILVSPYATNVVTDDAGHARIEPAPDAPFPVRIWHERLPDNTAPETRRVEPENGSIELTLTLTPAQADDDPFADLQRRFDSL
ncbi:methylamine utilization protein [Marinobacter bohaiensis]|uniref:methylamine utilization protein n=1 Tax=Marinobacter bohaiensis TaxID=2201898 RepID=UPI000DADFE17|nr:methylamine utilization protein [Marinobacter bohaiensis]